jgi:peptidoglycan hydrolase CwlO-like protein
LHQKNPIVKELRISPFQAVAAKVESSKHKSELADVRVSQSDSTTAVQRLENEIEELKRQHEEEKTEVQREQQEKVHRYNV